MGARVHVDFRKWPDRLHWQYAMERLGEDEHGHWLWAPAGTRLRRGEEPPKPSRRLLVKLVKPGAWWSPIFNEGEDREVYVDIATPARWRGATVTMVDLDLDVVRYRDGRTEVHDEDEFLEHLRRYAYPPDVVAAARAATAAVERALAARDEPFGAVGAAWLERAVALDANRSA